MLVELAIENLGVIERVNLAFGDGFTVLTGETGAGKTMVVEAINLVVGARADASVVLSALVAACAAARRRAADLHGVWRQPHCCALDRKSVV